MHFAPHLVPEIDVYGCIILGAKKFVLYPQIIDEESFIIEFAVVDSIGVYCRNELTLQWLINMVFILYSDSRIHEPNVKKKDLGTPPPCGLRFSWFWEFHLFWDEPPPHPHPHPAPQLSKNDVACLNLQMISKNTQEFYFYRFIVPKYSLYQKNRLFTKWLSQCPYLCHRLKPRSGVRISLSRREIIPHIGHDSSRP